MLFLVSRIPAPLACLQCLSEDCKPSNILLLTFLSLPSAILIIVIIDHILFCLATHSKLFLRLWRATSYNGAQSLRWSRVQIQPPDFSSPENISWVLRFRLSDNRLEPEYNRQRPEYSYSEPKYNRQTLEYKHKKPTKFTPLSQNIAVRDQNIIIRNRNITARNRNLTVRNRDKTTRNWNWALGTKFSPLHITSSKSVLRCPNRSRQYPLLPRARKPQNSESLKVQKSERPKIQIEIQVKSRDNLHYREHSPSRSAGATGRRARSRCNKKLDINTQTEN